MLRVSLLTLPIFPSPIHANWGAMVMLWTTPPTLSMGVFSDLVKGPVLDYALDLPLRHLLRESSINAHGDVSPRCRVLTGKPAHVVRSFSKRFLEMFSLFLLAPDP